MTQGAKVEPEAPCKNESQLRKKGVKSERKGNHGGACLVFSIFQRLNRKRLLCLQVSTVFVMTISCFVIEDNHFQETNSCCLCHCQTPKPWLTFDWHLLGIKYKLLVGVRGLSWDEAVWWDAAPSPAREPGDAVPCARSRRWGSSLPLSLCTWRSPGSPSTSCPQASSRFEGAAPRGGEVRDDVPLSSLHGLPGPPAELKGSTPWSTFLASTPHPHPASWGQTPLEPLHSQQEFSRTL